MGMIGKSPCMGMEYGGKSRFTAESFIISGKRLQGILDTCKQKGVYGFLIPPAQVSKLFGNGKGDQEIRGG